VSELAPASDCYSEGAAFDAPNFVAARVLGVVSGVVIAPLHGSRVVREYPLVTAPMTPRKVAAA